MLRRLGLVLLIVMLGTFMLLGLATVAAGQQAAVLRGAGPFNYGYVVDSARTKIEQSWDDSNSYQVERGFCVEPADVDVWITNDHANVEWRVRNLHPPVSIDLATPYAIVFNCSKTAIASIHVHTPTTCDHNPADPLGKHPKNCVLGGDDAYLCSVDEADRTSARHDVFMGVQCGKGQVVFYWPGRRG